MMIANINFSKIYAYLVKQGVIDFLTHFLVAILILIVGLWIIRRITKAINHYFDRRNVEKSIRSFLIPVIGFILKTVLVITVFREVGLETTSFIALLGSAGLAVGLALQGSLSNFAGGVLIILLKPFRVGEFIEAQGFSGTVKDIHLFNTILTTSNGQKVVIPNGELSNSSVINYSANPTRRLDLTFSVGYQSDINLVKEILLDFISKIDYLLKDPQPQVMFSEYTSHSVNFKVRGWVRNEDYWNVYWHLMHGVKELFDKNNILIPLQQMDVHIQAK